MQNLIKTSCIVFAAACLPTGAAAAPDRAPISIAEVEARAQAHFGEMDKNGDAMISIEEFADAEPAHRSRAGSRDGHAKRLHHRAGRPAQHADRELRRSEHAAKLSAELFSILDSDDDGVVSNNEFATGFTPANRAKAAKRVTFAGLDKDANGYLTADELSSRVQHLRRLDADGDGLVTRAEMQAARPMHRRPKPDNPA